MKDDGAAELTVEILDEMTPQIRDVWVSLVPDRRWGIFSHPDWCEAVWGHEGSTVLTRIVLVRRGGRPVGLLPVWIRRMNRYGLFLRVAELFGSRRGDYGAPLIAEDADATEVLPVLLDAALAIRGAGGTLIWPHLPDVDGHPEIVEQALRDRHLEFIREDSPCHVVELFGSYEDIAASWDGKKRRNVNRYRRKLLSEFDSLELVTFDTVDEALARLPDFFRMHDQRWIASGNPGTFDDRSVRAFFEDLVRRFAGKSLFFAALVAGDQAAAYRIGFVWDNSFLEYRAAFSWDLRRSSPGQVMTSVLIEDGVERGWAAIDLLGGDYAYKDRVSSTTRDRSTFFIRSRPFAPAYWWLTKGRPMAERSIGGVIYRVRSWWGKLRRGSGE